MARGPRMDAVRRGLMTKSARTALIIDAEASHNEAAKALPAVISDMETATEDPIQAIQSAPVKLIMAHLIKMTGFTPIPTDQVDAWRRICREASTT